MIAIDERQIGTVGALFRYPVKSMRAGKPAPSPSKRVTLSGYC